MILLFTNIPACRVKSKYSSFTKKKCFCTLSDSDTNLQYSKFFLKNGWKLPFDDARLGQISKFQ